IRTVGLGSCVGVVVYDSSIRTAAMAHVMLPDSLLAKGIVSNPAKFADRAVGELVEVLKQKGSTCKRLKAKIAGGAQMFQLKSGSESTRIGPRNVKEIERQLKRFDIHLAAAEVGGSSGRTIEFDTENETLIVRTVYQGTIEI
ncbi:MAG TPA: chemotaxis protein CheD, partial [Bacillales bacterium]|nr:chemotaxis protein CheD [Bacillales bacterium]